MIHQNMTRQVKNPEDLESTRDTMTEFGGEVLLTVNKKILVEQGTTWDKYVIIQKYPSCTLRYTNLLSILTREGQRREDNVSRDWDSLCPRSYEVTVEYTTMRVHVEKLVNDW